MFDGSATSELAGVLARMLVYRDRTCRDPYCDAPIRHLGHIEAAAAGGPTTTPPDTATDHDHHQHQGPGAEGDHMRRSGYGPRRSSGAAK